MVALTLPKRCEWQRVGTTVDKEGEGKVGRDEDNLRRLGLNKVLL